MLFTVDANNFNDEVLNARGMVLVNFWTQWSDECSKMSSHMHKIIGLLDEDDVIVHINWEQQRQLAKDLDVLGVPTLIIFIFGREVARYYGTMSKDELAGHILEAKNYNMTEGAR